MSASKTMEEHRETGLPGHVRVPLFGYSRDRRRFGGGLAGCEDVGFASANPT
jgi:hypothetical protein